MTTFPGSPNLTRGGIVALDPLTARPLRIIVFQFNPDTLTRTLQPQTIGQEPGDRLEALRLKGPPHETIKLDAEFDATEQLESPNGRPANQIVAKEGLAAQLAALETLVYPPSIRLLIHAAAPQAAFKQVDGWLSGKLKPSALELDLAGTPARQSGARPRQSGRPVHALPHRRGGGHPDRGRRARPSPHPSKGGRRASRRPP